MYLHVYVSFYYGAMCMCTYFHVDHVQMTGLCICSKTWVHAYAHMHAYQCITYAVILCNRSKNKQIQAHIQQKKALDVRPVCLSLGLNIHIHI
jgi:hypothetical protein